MCLNYSLYIFLATHYMPSFVNRDEKTGRTHEICVLLFLDFQVNVPLFMEIPIRQFGTRSIATYIEIHLN
jgi:hypothetical protein